MGFGLMAVEVIKYSFLLCVPALTILQMLIAINRKKSEELTTRVVVNLLLKKVAISILIIIALILLLALIASFIGFGDT